MLEINERKKSWCGGSINVDCDACSGGDPASNPMSERHSAGYLEMLEKWD